MFTNKKVGPEVIPVFRPKPEEAAYHPAYMRQISEGLWTTGLCDCWEDPSNCFFTMFCPCITLGRNSEIINRGEMLCRKATHLHIATGVLLFGWIFGWSNRKTLRQHFSLPETPFPDCCSHVFCMWCALCQEHRELQNRGAYPFLGWERNVEKWRKDGLTPPIVVPQMVR
ncbi:hypothetical protein SLE2022_096460 [Rubroshorea leprosula]